VRLGTAIWADYKHQLAAALQLIPKADFEALHHLGLEASGDLEKA